jgi:hypothetical protein
MPERAEYGSGTGEPVSWEEAERQLSEARYHWLSTTRPDGRPHAVPIWAVWWEAGLYFATGPGTVTARNLATNPNAVAHPDDPRKVVIVEGVVERLGAAVPLEAVSGYEAKYGWRIEIDDPGMPFFALRPATVLAWHADEVRGTASRWAL